MVEDNENRMEMAAHDRDGEDATETEKAHEEPLRCGAASAGTDKRRK